MVDGFLGLLVLQNPGLTRPCAAAAVGRCVLAAWDRCPRKFALLAVRDDTLSQFAATVACAFTGVVSRTDAILKCLLIMLM